MSDRILNMAGGLPNALKSDLLVEMPVPRRINDSSDRFRPTFRQLMLIIDDINRKDEWNQQGFELSTSRQDITGSEISGMNKAEWDNIMDRMKSNSKSHLTQDDMTAVRVEMELRRAFLEQKHSSFFVTTPTVIKSADRQRNINPVNLNFDCRDTSNVRKFLQPFELLFFLTEFCEETLSLLANDKLPTYQTVTNELQKLQAHQNLSRATGERMTAREEAKQCYLEITSTIVKAAHTALANSIIQGLRTCVDQLRNLGLFHKTETSANFSDFVKVIGNESFQGNKTNKTTGGAYNTDSAIPEKLRQVISIVRYIYKLNHYSTFHFLKDVSKSLDIDRLESIRYQSQKLKVAYTPRTRARKDNANTIIVVRVPEILTTPDLIALVRQFDSKFCRVISGQETDHNAFYSTYRDSKGNYTISRVAPAALTINRTESLSQDLLTPASKNFKVGVALFDSWSRGMQLKTVSNLVLHPRTTGTEGEFLTPGKVVSLFYSDMTMMSKVDFDEDDNFLARARLAVSFDLKNEPVHLTKDANPKQQEAFTAAIQKFQDCLLRYDLDSSPATIDDFNSQKSLTQSYSQNVQFKTSQTRFDVFRTSNLDTTRFHMAQTAIPGQERPPDVHLMFIPVLASILTFIQRRDEYDLFVDPLCANSHVLTRDSCLALVAVDSRDHTLYVFDPMSSNEARRERILAILVLMLSMSVRFRKPQAFSSYTASDFASYYTMSPTNNKSKKAWFEELLALAQSIIQDYERADPPILYYNSSNFVSEHIQVVQREEEFKIEKDGKATYGLQREVLMTVPTPVLSAVLTCRYADHLMNNWTIPDSSRKDPTRARNLLSPNAFIQREFGPVGVGAAGGESKYIERIIQRFFGAVFRVPKPYVPYNFGNKGKKGNSSNNNNSRFNDNRNPSGRGRGRGRDRGRGRGR